MPDDFTLIRVSKNVVHRLNIAKSIAGEDQQVTADRYLTDGMDRAKIPIPDMGSVSTLRSQRAKPLPKRKEIAK